MNSTTVIPIGKLIANSRKTQVQSPSNPIKEKEVPKRLFTWAEIIKHDKPDDCWIVIHGKVYDVTNFVKNHPG